MGKETNSTRIWKWDVEPGNFDKYNIWQRSNSNSIFIRKSGLSFPLVFNKELGVGSATPWGSEEEIDLLLWILESSHKIFYNPKFLFIMRITFRLMMKRL